MKQFVYNSDINMQSLYCTHEISKDKFNAVLILLIGQVIWQSKVFNSEVNLPLNKKLFKMLEKELFNSGVFDILFISLCCVVVRLTSNVFVI